MDARSWCRIIRGQGPLGKHGRAVRSRVFSLASLRTNRENVPNVNPFELTFATKFLSTYLFIKVKGSRPMTYQYLAVEIINAAKANGGFIDQKTFKTAGKYGFDSVILADTSMQILNGYINFVRPLLKSQSDFVLVTKNGSQHSKLGNEILLLPIQLACCKRFRWKGDLGPEGTSFEAIAMWHM